MLDSYLGKVIDFLFYDERRLMCHYCLQYHCKDCIIQNDKQSNIQTLFKLLNQSSLLYC